jgi:hypothetical protein
MGGSQRRDLLGGQVTICGIVREVHVR